ncbi:peptidase T (plasmid) [Fulvitalea axinellae]|uniref:Peptidase T n=1 Tax=Fulvitalea axinellae TaxID=1182444 RepID=A0AAU9CIR4_9BACT|nr:peptidase T [Fulvitalea axinellae]
MTLVERFLRYVKVYTTSKPGVEAIPSTQRQFELAHILVEELKEIGMEDVMIDDHCYVYASLPSNVDHEVPTIGFVAHMDTSPDFSGENVNPRIVENYDGGDIVLNKDKDIVLSPNDFPELTDYKGQTLITTDGTTLLGADDKAGVAEIMTAMDYLIQHPEIKHGEIRICFTPDEEVGKGANLFDVDKFGAEWAYTMDGGKIGELEYESFNAAYAKINFTGRMVHPGYAKGKMVNSMGIAAGFANALPADEVPERTEGREGFFHLMNFQGSVEETVLEYIVRDHDMNIFKERKAFVEHLVNRFNKEHGEGTVKLDMNDQYYNMGEKIKPVYHIVEIAEKAFRELGVEPNVKPIRGGTDGARLSYMGLPCPNIFAGGHNFHGKYEYVPVQSMEKAVQIICKIAELTAEQNA